MDIETLKTIVVIRSKEQLKKQIAENGGIESINIITLRKAVDYVYTSSFINSSRDKRAIISNYITILRMMINVALDDVESWSASNL